MKVREGFVHVLWDHWHPDCLYRVFPTAIVVTRIDKATALAYAILCTLVVGTFTQEIALHIQYHLASLSAEKVELYRVFLKLGFKLSLSLSLARSHAHPFTHWITLGLLSGWWGHYENSGYNQCSAPREDLTSTISLAVGGLLQL